MEFTTKTPQELTPSEIDLWRKLVSDEHHLGSPFLHPVYSQLLADYRPQLEVALIKDNGQLLGIMPFERHDQKTARPLGVKLADFQGIICKSECSFEITELMRQIGLNQFHYDHLLLQNKDSIVGMHRIDDSPYLDLSQSYESYLKNRKQAGSSLISQVQRKQRKLIREQGELTFQWHDEDPLAWQLLFQWKSAQRAHTQTVNILEIDWVQQFLNKVTNYHSDEFGGQLSTLRLDGKIIAVHLGMHTSNTFHYWFPTYDASLGKYSPGLILLLRMAEEAAARGMVKYDLGKGEEGYKASFASASIPVVTGTADLSVTRQWIHSSWYRAKTALKSSPLKKIIQRPKKLIKQWQTQLTMGAS